MINRKVLMYACLVLSVVSCTRKDAKGDHEPMTVKVCHAETSANESEREFTFISKPYKTTDLSFRVSGPVTVFDVQSGQFFRKGELIAAIDNRDFSIRAEKAEAVYRQADAEYKRIAGLYEKNNVSGSSYEKAKSDLAIAKAAFETAGNELADSKLIAPFDGYVQTVNIERFQDVRASQPVVSFIDLSRLKLETYLPEEVAFHLRKPSGNTGTEVKIKFDGMKDKTYTTSDLNISKSTTDNNISFLLTAILDNKDNSLLGGMAGSLSLPTSLTSTQTSVFIPQIAVCNRPETGTFVWVVTEDKRVKPVPVTIGKLKRGSRIEILSGIQTGDVVALTRLSFLNNNDLVTTQE